MLGQVCWDETLGQKITLTAQDLLTLRVLQGRISPKEFLRTWRLGRLAQRLRRHGISRVLVPDGFVHWDIFEEYGLSPVAPLPFLRSVAGPLLLSALVAQGYQPARCVVALRGRRGTAEMERAAQYLLPHVRDIIISAPIGGESLATWLRNEWGIACRPDREDVEGAICFDETAQQCGGQVITLFGGKIYLCGLGIKLAGTNPIYESEQLPLLTALWETGRVELDGIEFYLT